jgi:thymidylate synthase ThyX
LPEFLEMLEDANPGPAPYYLETFTNDERNVLDRHFTNLDGPVFALLNMPEAVKGALFARYSRTGKSLRRLFLDEFYRGETLPDVSETGLVRAEELYDRIFIEFGDDSVAQLGGAHIAVEQGSNVLTKALEWGRLAAYLEQSTRYVPYDDRPGGRYRYYLEPDIMSSAHAAEYVGTLDSIFASYGEVLKKVTDGLKRLFPKQPDDSDRVYRMTIRAKALDLLRGMLPAATTSNTGIYATGQAFENMLLRMRGSQLKEVRQVADMMLVELNKVIPVFLQRIEQPDRGGAWTEYLVETRREVDAAASELIAGEVPNQAPAVTLVDWDRDAEEKLIAAMLYSSADLPEVQLIEKVRQMSIEDRKTIVAAYVGDRRNRRHKPGRALERIDYRFDLLTDYGAFRDLQRHRLLTLERQDLSPRHGYEIPPTLEELNVSADYLTAMEASESLWNSLSGDLPLQAQYAVCMAYRVRFVLQLNAREAMHLIELRSSPQGHPSYRGIAQEMHRQIRDVAGHRIVADMMKYVDYGDVDLERLDAERRADRKRQEMASDK